MITKGPGCRGATKSNLAGVTAMDIKIGLQPRRPAMAMKGQRFPPSDSLISPRVFGHALPDYLGGGSASICPLNSTERRAVSAETFSLCLNQRRMTHPPDPGRSPP
jgi:hypothetical protein